MPRHAIPDEYVKYRHHPSTRFFFISLSHVLYTMYGVCPTIGKVHLALRLVQKIPSLLGSSLLGKAQNMLVSYSCTSMCGFERWEPLQRFLIGIRTMYIHTPYKTLLFHPALGRNWGHRYNGSWSGQRCCVGGRNWSQVLGKHHMDPGRVDDDV